MGGEVCERDCVKKIIKTNSGLLFKLGNHVIQMCFSDGSQLIASFKNKVIVFITKAKEKQVYKISKELLKAENAKVVKRLRYVVNLINTLNPIFSNGILSLKKVPSRCVGVKK
eukprot:TRINITY_DN2927_c0_g4_i1.p1 TRINITY_DN2927_c0_g4~~TRINITY_DN2927_c0_g4_i1.p1  ORF type:complete len:125 (-),score=40.25 TRINITY_DN2927_c0_g4_i1:140-478(-)